MAGRLDFSLRSLEVNSLRRGLESSTTSMARLWRRKPWMKSSGCASLSWGMMSFCTVGVAVAVRAMTGGGRGGGGKSRGCDEKELESAVEVVAAGLTGFVAREARVDAGYAKASGGEFGSLVVH